MKVSQLKVKLNSGTCVRIVCATTENVACEGYACDIPAMFLSWTIQHMHIRYKTPPSLVIRVYSRESRCGE